MFKGSKLSYSVNLAMLGGNALQETTFQEFTNFLRDLEVIIR